MNTHQILITFSLAAVFGVIATLIAQRLKTSTIVMLLLIGVAAGPEFLNIIQPSSLGAGLSTIISLSVAIILFEGGLTLDTKGYKQVSSEILSVLTWGVLITWIMTALILWVLFPFDLIFCLLAGSLIIVTGPTVIGPLLHRIRVSKKLHNILYWEGVLIDPIGVFIALLCYEWLISAGEPSAYINFVFRFLVGGFVGLIFGMSLYYILKRNWIPEERLNFCVLASAILNFAIADSIISESGLLSVTVAGFILGYKDTPQLDRIIEYKVELKDFLIGLLFILLAANLKLASFVDYGLPLGITLIMVMIVVRPANIFYSTRNSTLELKEKLFLSWVAPRGIVAASMASLFAFHLSAKGFENARFLETFTYSVIAGTVIFQGFTAKPLGYLLGVLEPKPTGWLIIGAHKLARSVARFIQSEGESAILLDTNPREVRLAKREGLTALCENAMSIDQAQHLELYPVGNVLAITENEDLNHLLCSRWQRLLRNARLYYWGYGNSNGEALPGPAKVNAIWSHIDIKSMISSDKKNEMLITCTSHYNLPAHPPAGDILMYKEGDTFYPRLMEKQEGDAIFLTLKPGLNLSDSTKKEWVLLSKDKTLKTLYKKMLFQIKGNFPLLDMEALLKELLEREREFSSFIGNKISLPHTYARDIEESTLIVAKVAPPIIRHGSEEEVSLVFMVISPEDEPEIHLNHISKISKFVMKEETREALIKASTKEELFELLKNG